MKIALITIHRTNNYGALLQVYATQFILEKYGHVTVIDYRNPLVESSLKRLRFSFSISGFKALAKDVLRLLPRIRALKKVNNFIETELNLSESFDAHSIKKNLNLEFDYYVCGSDQIWNPNCVSAIAELDENYFCAFAKDESKRISYASSAGAHNFSDKETEKLKHLLSKFSSLSVREEALSKFLESLMSKEVAHVLDPTLLLSESDWLRILSNTVQHEREEVPDDYILVYTVPKSKLLTSAITSVKKHLGLKVVSIDQGLYTGHDVDVQIRDASPYEFIDLFSKAAFVITDSFHGVCFSINFNKPFMAVSPGAYSNRIDSLLNALGLTDKCVSGIADIDQFNYDFDFISSGVTLESKRNYSLEYINSAFSSK